MAASNIVSKDSEVEPLTQANFNWKCPGVPFEDADTASDTGGDEWRGTAGSGLRLSNSEREGPSSESQDARVALYCPLSRVGCLLKRPGEKLLPKQGIKETLRKKTV